MEKKPFEKTWQKKSRFLTHALLISGGLNIGLLSTFAYFAFSKNHRVQLEKSQKEISVSETNAEVIKSFFQSSFDELVFELQNTKLLENGYKKRDLALAYLVDYHYLNLDQALSGYSYQKRWMTFLNHDGGEKFELMVYPGLKDEHFHSIITFIQKEKWPFTAEGLYYEICCQKHDISNELKDAFYSTPYFYAVYTLLSRAESSISREEVLAMIIEGEWSDLENSYLKQRIYPDLGVEERIQLLHQYVLKSSKIAAYLLVRLDTEYAIKKMSDKDLLKVISLLKVKNSTTSQFLKQLLISIRSDDIHIATAKKLYQLEGMVIPDPFDYQRALIDFLPAIVSKQQHLNTYTKDPINEAIKQYNQEDAFIMHVVKEGDSLWKIAKFYNIDINRIIQYNKLSKQQTLSVGKKLKIPKK
ncbi:MAG: LysM peptidoglycan-binding domain-containing protein [Chlamydiales bacterium]|nr:LysM peptidoglycan-binding domain-containing protein [Chlamydiales bacterium]